MRQNLEPIVAAEGFAAAGGEERRAQILIAALKRHIERLDGTATRFGARRRAGAAWRFGIEAIDTHLPAGGLARPGLHDIAPAAYGDMPAVMGFAAALAVALFEADGRERRPLLWCRLDREVREYGRLFGHGLEGLGIARARFLTVALKTPIAALWTMEEALKSGAFALVIGDGDGKLSDLTATRRLVLAAGEGGAAGLLLFARAHEAATASHTRWRVASRASEAPPYDTQSPGPPAWDIDLIRARGGRAGQWQVSWHNAPHRFDLVPGIRGGAFHPYADENVPARAGARG